MVKKTLKNTHQPTLFRREVPQMPEGYYSSGPNPNLRRFVKELAKPYNWATDEYRIAAFAEQITVPKRKSPAMDLHIYWSKKSRHAIREYVKHYTNPNDLVLDPFCGSGGTALAALSEGTWRPPANDKEPQQKAALRSSGALRWRKRFANALLDECCRRSEIGLKMPLHWLAGSASAAVPVFLN